jgi:putative membrane protein insertion efficiency factor
MTIPPLHMGQRIAIRAIVLYQRTLSPDHGPLATRSTIGCRYYPSCSEYAKRAIIKDGLFIGSIRALWRILRCNPFSSGGVDEP